LIKKNPAFLILIPWVRFLSLYFFYNSLATNKPAEFLPICGGNTRVKGYDLPEPFGVGVNYINR
jgi:hypothetical protein